LAVIENLNREDEYDTAISEMCLLKQYISPSLEGPACPPKTKLVLLSAGGPAHLPLKFGMHSCRQGLGGGW